MAPIIFFFICFGIWYLWIKLSPNHSAMIKIKFGYVGRRNSSYNHDAVKIPGKIVGMKKDSYYSYSGNNPGRKYKYYLIVEYINPDTGQLEEYVTPQVNGNPYYYLASLDVTVYYKDAENIWVDDFKRIKKLRDNVAYQRTGSVEGKMPEDFRIEEIERTN